MITKYLLLFTFFIAANTFSMHNKTATKNNNLPFLIYLSQNIDFTKKTIGNIERYDSTKHLLENVILKTVICAQNAIHGSKEIIITTDNGEELPIASLQYSIINQKCCINIIETDPQFQRQGYGRMLLTDLEQEIKEGHCTKISLTALNTAEGFYLKHGFVKKNTHGRMNKNLM